MVNNSISNLENKRRRLLNIRSKAVTDQNRHTIGYQLSEIESQIADKQRKQSSWFGWGRKSRRGTRRRSRRRGCTRRRKH